MEDETIKRIEIYKILLEIQNRDLGLIEAIEDIMSLFKEE